MKSLGRAIIYYDWCPYKKRSLETDIHTDYLKIQEEDGQLQAEEKGPQKKPTLPTL